MSSASPRLGAGATAWDPARRDRRPELALGRAVAVAERVIVEKPFCRLIHLERDARRCDPRLLVVAPLSGHFAALLEDLLAALAPDHDLYLADWTDAREVPVEQGEFGVAENIGYVLDFVGRLGAPLHLLGLCQSAMPVLAATALLAAGRGPAQPRSMTLINGMLDARISPTRIDRFARLCSLSWYERHAIAAVPAGYPGEGRRVHPATLQQAALMTYLARHLATAGELLGKALGEDEGEAAGQRFLELYLSAMDLPAAFFLDTIRLVFHEFALPRGVLYWRGERVEPEAIAATALMTVEGERDDVSAPGQTRIAHELCRNIPHHRRVHHLAPGVGHFGTFHGRVWRGAVLPRIRSFIRAMS
jgi:poly(3-hydroxybutyrate) depolymerase